MVVGVFLGRLTNDYYVIKVERAEERENEIVVYYSKQAATDLEIRNIGEFAPFELIEVLKTDKPIRVGAMEYEPGETSRGVRQGE